MTSRNKMSKKAQKELNSQKRVTWGFSPVSRVKASKKVYDRKRKENYDETHDAPERLRSKMC